MDIEINGEHGDRYITIKVNWGYYYDISPIIAIGDPTNKPCCGSVWGWINHLRPKVWWSKDLEERLLVLAKEIINENKN